MIVSKLKDIILSNGSATKLSGDRNNCAVTALSAAFDIPYDKADSFATQAWNRKRKRGTNTQAIVKTFTDAKELFNKNIEPVSPVNEYHTKEKVVNCRYKLYNFAKKYNKGTYYTLVRGHATVIKNGIVLDNFKPGSIVNHVWKISDID